MSMKRCSKMVEKAPYMFLHRLSDRAIYLGNGVWWRLTEQQKREGLAKNMSERVVNTHD